MNVAQALLLPFSLLYSIGGSIRNRLFDIRVLRETGFELPIISVGNLSAGGTGKTPHVEYLIRLLSEQFPQITTLSRGYGRKTKGFLLADDNASSVEIGDEPAQIFGKFPQIRVAVDACRTRGVRQLLNMDPPTDMILLDDAFQHRYVKPGLSILLTDYFRPYFQEHVLPSGRLRECRRGARRADIIVVTKCPPVLSPITRKSYIDKIKPRPHQHIFFSYIKYSSLLPVFPDNCPAVNDERKFYTIVLFAGIANPYPLQEHLRRSCIELETARFPDHYRYTTNDVLRIRERFRNIVGKNKVIVTTEKDRARLQNPEFEKIFEGIPLFYQPIEVDFFKEDKKWFDQQILEYAGKNQAKC